MAKLSAAGSLVGALLCLVACRQGAGGQAPPHITTVSLNGMPVGLVLPAGWKLLPAQSDEDAGMVAFSPDRPVLGVPEQQASAFLDGTREGAVVPASLASATEQVLAHDWCKSPAVCTVRDREALPGGGYLVSIKTPQSVFVESWLPAPNGRGVRCGGEVSALAALHIHPKTWLDDPTEVDRAGVTIEAICRSVTMTP